MEPGNRLINIRLLPNTSFNDGAALRWAKAHMCRLVPDAPWTTLVAYDSTSHGRVISALSVDLDHCMNLPPDTFRDSPVLRAYSVEAYHRRTLDLPEARRIPPDPNEVGTVAKYRLNDAVVRLFRLPKTGELQLLIQARRMGAWQLSRRICLRHT